MTSSLIEISCPICKNRTNTLKRYPSRVCNDCGSKATDFRGESISFSNNPRGGHGVVGRYREARENYDSKYCYINCYICEVKEARFGGLVIQKIEESPFNTAVDKYAHEVEEDNKVVPGWFSNRWGADEGNFRAMIGLSSMYRDGIGVSQDHQKAKYWREKSEIKRNEIIAQRKRGKKINVISK